MGLPRVNAEAPRRAFLGSAANGLCAAVAGVSRLEAPARPAAGPCASGRPFGPKPAQPRVFGNRQCGTSRRGPARSRLRRHFSGAGFCSTRRRGADAARYTYFWRSSALQSSTTTGRLASDSTSIAGAREDENKQPAQQPAPWCSHCKSVNAAHRCNRYQKLVHTRHEGDCKNAADSRCVTLCIRGILLDGRRDQLVT